MTLRPPKPALFEALYRRRLVTAWAAFAARVRASRGADLNEAQAAFLRAAGVTDFTHAHARELVELHRQFTMRILPAVRRDAAEDDVRIPPPNEFRAQIEKFRQENVALVTRMSAEERQAIADIIRPAQAAGKRWEDIAGDIDARLGVGERRARLIARDQTNKFSASVQRAVQTSAGVEKYRWRTVDDNAVRGRPGGEWTRPGGESHWALRGRIFRWDAPPLIPGTDEHAHPGERPNCRCFAEPVLDEYFGGASAPFVPPPPAPVPFVSVPRTAPVRVAPVTPQIREVRLPTPLPGDLTKGGKLPMRPESTEFLRAGGTPTKALPVIVAVYPDGSVFPRDGRHRITLARSRGERTIVGDVVYVGPKGGEKWVRNVRIPL